MFSPFRIFFPVLWPLLTSCRSLLLRIFFASARPPRVLTHSFPLYLPHLPKAIPCSYWALFCYANLPSLTALYAISVRQARVLPIGRPFNSQNPAFFRFHLTMDTLAVLLYTSSLPRRVRDFHPLERAHGAQTKKSTIWGNGGFKKGENL